MVCSPSSAWSGWHTSAQKITHTTYLKKNGPCNVKPMSPNLAALAMSICTGLRADLQLMVWHVTSPNAISEQEVKAALCIGCSLFKNCMAVQLCFRTAG